MTVVLITHFSHIRVKYLNHMNLWYWAARAGSRKVSIAQASGTLHRRIVCLCRLFDWSIVVRSGTAPAPTSVIIATPSPTSAFAECESCGKPSSQRTYVHYNHCQ